MISLGLAQAQQITIYVWFIYFVCFTGSTRIWGNPYNSQVRLSQGAYSSQGLVEVYCNGQWGTVCDDFFYQTEADTVCKQLGYTGAAAYDNLTP